MLGNGVGGGGLVQCPCIVQGLGSSPSLKNNNKQTNKPRKKTQEERTTARIQGQKPA